MIIYPNTAYKSMQISQHKNIVFQHTKNIISRIDFWLEKYTQIATEHSKIRRANINSKKQLIKAALGLFANIGYKNSRGAIAYYIQGPRNLHYFKSTNPKEITLIGSHAEKILAREQGHKFLWSFPIESACNVSRSLGVDFFLERIFAIWLGKLSKNELSIIIIYEDTQAVGAFLAELGKIKSRSIKSICVQHGYFPYINNMIPNDGSFTEFNFVWDREQCKIIKCDEKKTYDIGPPILERVKSEKISRIIFVGTGTNDDGSSDYKDTLREYSQIYSELHSDLKKICQYRPHPNETGLINGEQGADKIPAPVNNQKKKDLLCSSRAIFIGTVSSLLFEAHYCGHVVIALDICEYARLSFKPHARFIRNETKNVASLVQDIANGDFTAMVTQRSPETSFDDAIQVIKGTLNDVTCELQH